MTLSTDTIRTVIEIVPDWTATDHVCHTPLGLDNVYWDKMHPAILDALAAAAVRVFEEKEIASIYPIQGVTEIQWEYENSDTLDSITIRGPNRTNNTLEAIAEWVKGGGFDQKKAEQGDYIPGQDRSGKSGGFESE